MAPRKPMASSQNPELIHKIGKHSQSKMYHKCRIWAIKAKQDCVFPHHEPKAVLPMPAEKPPKYYPADDVKQPIPNILLLSSLRALVFLSSPLLQRERWHQPLLERHPLLRHPCRHRCPRPSLPLGRCHPCQAPAVEAAAPVREGGGDGPPGGGPRPAARDLGDGFSLRLLVGARRKPTLLRHPSSPLSIFSCSDPLLCFWPPLPWLCRHPLPLCSWLQDL